MSRRLIRDPVKSVQHEILDEVASLLTEGTVPEMIRIFGRGVVLVPVPRSRPFQDTVPWPSLEICHSFAARGLVREAWPGLRRTHSIRQSCSSELGNRPDPEEHSKSLSVTGSVRNATKFLLVDDFVTRGSTLISCAGALREAFPGAEVKAFALVNTLGPGEEVMNLLNPRFGEICYESGELSRSSWTDRVSDLRQGEKGSYEQSLSL